VPNAKTVECQNRLALGASLGLLGAYGWGRSRGCVPLRSLSRTKNTKVMCHGFGTARFLLLARFWRFGTARHTVEWCRRVSARFSILMWARAKNLCCTMRFTHICWITRRVCELLPSIPEATSNQALPAYNTEKQRRDHNNDRSANSGHSRADSHFSILALTSAYLPENTKQWS
jgi:hypothetical protein